MSALAEVESQVAKTIQAAMDIRRYGRAVSAMTPRVRFVHQVLCELYDHPAIRGDQGSGMNSIARLMKFGAMGAGQFGPTVPLELPGHLIVVKEAVDYLGRRMRLAIDLNYGRGDPIYSIARDLGVSEDVARSLLKHARPIIASFLAGRGVKLPYEDGTNC